MPSTRRPLRNQPVLWVAVSVAWAVLASATTAHSFVYWSGDKGIARAQADGSAPELDFIPDVSAQDLEVGDAFIYWARDPDPRDPFPPAIARASILESTDPQTRFILTAGDPQAVAIDDTYIYWAQYLGVGTPEFHAVIGRARLDGSDVDQEFIALETFGVGDLEVDGDYIYWTHLAPPCCASGEIGRVRLDGTDYEPEFVQTRDFSHGLSVAGGHLYWTNQPSDTSQGPATSIGRADLDGTNVDQDFVEGAIYPFDVVAGDERLYWTNSLPGPGSFASIGSALLDGADANQSFIPNAARYYPYGIAFDKRTDGAVSARVHARRRQRQSDDAVRIELKVRAREAMSVLASGKIRGGNSVELHQRRVRFRGAGKKVLSLKPARNRETAVVLETLARKGQIPVRLKAKMTDSAGNRERVRLRVRLVRQK